MSPRQLPTRTISPRHQIRQIFDILLLVDECVGWRLVGTFLLFILRPKLNNSCCCEGIDLMLELTMYYWDEVSTSLHYLLLSLNNFKLFISQFFTQQTGPVCYCMSDNYCVEPQYYLFDTYNKDKTHISWNSFYGHSITQKC